MSRLRRTVLSGLGWQTGGALASQGIALGVGVLLARALSPAEFGLVAMVGVVSGFLGVYTQLGLGAAVVQMREAGEAHLSSAFWVNVAAGLAFSVALLAAAPLLAWFYGEPALTALASVLALEFAVSSLAVVQLALLRREMRFARLSLVDAGASLASGLLAVGLALSGWGVWSLVARSLAATVLRTAALWGLSDWRPRPIFRVEALRELMGFARPLLGTETLNYWTRNLDGLLLGRFAGAEALGLYNRAYRLLLVPLQSGTRVVGSVLFPALSRIRDERSRVRSIFVRSARGVALASFPVHLGLLATADLAIPSVFGPQWTPMVPIARIFAVTGLVQSLASLNRSLYLSQGRTDLLLRYGLLLRLNLILGIVVGLRWGAVGVAAGYTIASLANYYPNTRIAGGLVGLRVGDVLGAVAGVLGCAAAAAALAWSAGRALAPAWGAPGALLAQLAVLGGSYLGLLSLFRVAAFSDVVRAIREQAGARDPATPAELGA